MARALKDLDLNKLPLLQKNLEAAKKQHVTQERLGNDSRLLEEQAKIYDAFIDVVGSERVLSEDVLKTLHTVTFGRIDPNRGISDAAWRENIGAFNDTFYSDKSPLEKFIYKLDLEKVDVDTPPPPPPEGADTATFKLRFSTHNSTPYIKEQAKELTELLGSELVSHQLLQRDLTLKVKKGSAAEALMKMSAAHKEALSSPGGD